VISTASASYRPMYAEEYGYLHLEAVEKDYREKELSYLLVYEVIIYIKKRGEIR
jgi:hypothetical protein